MVILFHWGVWWFWTIFYSAVICVCFLGKKKNTNRGWNLFIVAEILFLLTHIPSIYFMFYTRKFIYYQYFAMGLIIPISMMIWIVGLYYIATNKDH